MPGFSTFDIASTALFSLQTSGKRLGDPWNGQQSFFIMDVSITEEHSSDIQVTEHPVEFGADVTDNARPKPDTLTVEGFISNTPFGEFWGNYDPETQATTKGYQFPMEAVDNQAGPGRSQAAFDLLRKLKDDSTPLSITTALHYYPTMLIESLRFPRDAQTGDSLRVTLKLKSVRFVTSETTQITVAATNAQGKIKKGPQTSKPIPDGPIKSEQARLFDAAHHGKTANVSGPASLGF